MKKHLALVLALVMVLTSFSFVSAAPDFSDMNDQPSAEAVARLELLNVLKGYPDGTFRPEGEITRAEFAAVAVRISGLEGAAQSAQGTISAFSDVPAWHWASGYVGIAASTGIVNGIGNGLFAPEAPVKYEEAVTMLVRALGYEPEAQSKGGYPYGYLIVAEDIDLLDGLRGSLGVNATRGLVAMLTDNALEIPMMVSVGFGDNIRWVVSGTERTEKVYLIEKMGYEPVEGRVTSFSTSRKTVTLAGEGTFDVMDSFDYLETEGVEIKAWVDKDDLVVAYVLQETVYFDAVKYDEDNDIELVTLDDVFEVDEDATLSLNEETVRFSNLSTFNADFAKVVINDDGDVIWAKGYDFDEFIVVEEVDGTEIIAFDEFNEADLDDYDVMKDGKTIAVADIAEGDVVFLNNNKEFAVVYNSTESGIVDRAYENSFRMDGSVYDISALGAVYLEDGDMGDVNDDVLEEFVDEAADIDIFFDFYGDVVLMSGDKGTAKTSTFGMFLEADPQDYANTRTNKYYLSLDGVNSEGVDVSFDATNKVVTDSGFAALTGNDVDWSYAAANDVIKYTVDEDGDLTKIKVIGSDYYAATANKEFEITDRYAGDYRLKSSTVFFLLDEDGDLDEVFTLADADEFFDEVMEFEVFSDLGVYADYIVVYESDAVADTQEFGVLTRVRPLANGDDVELSINIEGSSYVFVVDKDDVADALEVTTAKGTIISFLINEDMDEIRDVKVGVAGRTDIIGNTISGTFRLNSADGNRQFRLDGETAVFELDSAVILDATGTTKSITFSSIKAGDTVNVYYEGSLSRDKVFVRYLVVVDKADSLTPPGETGVVTYIDSTNYTIEVEYADGSVVEYELTGSARNLVNTLNVDDVIELEFTDGRVTGATIVESPAAAQPVIDAIAALAFVDEANPTAAEITAVEDARADYEALTEANQALVTNLADLEAAELVVDTAAAAAVDTEIAALSFVDPANPTAAEITAVETARANYEALTAVQQGLVANLADLEAAETTIAEAEALAAVTGAADKYEMKTALETYAEVLGLGTTDYDALSGTDQLTVAEYVFDQSPASIADVQTAFDAGVALVQ